MESLKALINRHLMEQKKSIREFAREAGVAQSTISRILSDEFVGYPSLETLDAVSKVLRLDFFTIVRAAYPADGSLDASVEALAEKISQLPSDQREIVENIVSGMLLKQGKDNS